MTATLLGKYTGRAVFRIDLSRVVSKYIDETFARRFQTIIHFPMPRAEERYEIWQKTFPPQITVAADIDWRIVAARYELSGAAILNVTHYCAVEILAGQAQFLDLKRLEAAILREYVKEGKVV
ncbi:MAG: hypothetical protein ACU837_14505 [Gammaproteobacteria bacterium]